VRVEKMGLRGGWFGLLVSLALVGCKSDQEAQLDLPVEPIAAGAWFPLSVTDLCGAGGGKINFCSQESVVSVDAFSVAKPRIAEVLRMEELEEGIRDETAELVIIAKEAGSTTISVDSTFDDGSQRKVEAKVEVRKADRIAVSHHCYVSEVDDERLLPVDYELPLEVTLLAAGQELAGEHQRELLSGEGLERRPGRLQHNPYSWRTPAAGGTVKLSSPLFPKFGSSYTIYDLDEVAIERVARRYPGEELSFEQGVVFEVGLSVRGKRPCAFPPVRFEVSTPDVCIGPKDATSWLVTSLDTLFAVSALATGSCKLVVSVEGTDVQFEVEEELQLEPGSLPEADPCEGVVCEEPSECPMNTELARRECCATCVPVVDADRCEDQRAVWDPFYEAELAKANQCEKDADCSSVVLLGGCRRYCQVPLNTARIVDFMGTISEGYYTSCSGCRVDDQVGCTGVDGRAHCEDGLCKMGP
jgi:hypothetical protein